MSMISLGDLAQTYMLRRQNAEVKAAVQRLAQETTTGLAADLGRAVQGDFSMLAGIEASLARLDAYRAATADLALRTGAMQTVVTHLGATATALGPELLSTASSGNPTRLDAIGAEAVAALSRAVAALNTGVGNRTLFAGEATAGAAMADAETILAALDAATAGADTAGAVAEAIDAWFADPAGYDAVAYLGGAPAAPFPVAAGENLRIAVTAADPAVRDTLKGMALAAMLDRGVLAGNPEQRAELAQLAGSALTISATARADLSARLGVAEGQVAAAESRNGAESSALQIARVGLVSVDRFEAATALTEAETQLEALYAITARLSRLNLANYLT